MSQHPPRVKLALVPGRLARWWAEVKWASEQFSQDHVRDKDGEELEYLSVQEHEELLREARAEAFEEAILMANARRKRHHNSLQTSLKLAAEAARGAP